jgi:hypothetical protein
MTANVLGTAFEPAVCMRTDDQLIKVSGVQISKVMVRRTAVPAFPALPLCVT